MPKRYHKKFIRESVINFRPDNTEMSGQAKESAKRLMTKTEKSKEQTLLTKNVVGN